MFHHLTKGWGRRKGIQEMKLSPHTLGTHENVLTGPGFYAQLSASLDRSLTFPNVPFPHSKELGGWEWT